jgi:NADPH-dependent glutamate synthase beta subunit-like oxidoreductase
MKIWWINLENITLAGKIAINATGSIVVVGTLNGSLRGANAAYVLGCQKSTHEKIPRRKRARKSSNKQMKKKISFEGKNLKNGYLDFWTSGLLDFWTSGLLYPIIPAFARAKDAENENPS